MTITREMRLKAAETATPDQLWLYGSEDAAEKLQSILLKHNITDHTQNRQCVTLVANIVLRFHKATELPELLGHIVTLPFRETLSLTADLLDYLELKAPGGGTAKAATPDTTITPVPVVSSAPRPLSAQPTNLIADIAEAEAALQSLTPLRTMAQDMSTLKSSTVAHSSSEIPTFTSSQSALIKEAERAPIRPNNPAAGPSWGTGS